MIPVGPRERPRIERRRNEEEVLAVRPRDARRARGGRRVAEEPLGEKRGRERGVFYQENRV